jgi:excisionase family DNA binding protein
MFTCSRGSAVIQRSIIHFGGFQQSKSALYGIGRPFDFHRILKTEGPSMTILDRQRRYHMQPYPTTTQVAAILNVSRPTVARYVREGWLRGSRIGRSWRIDPASVEHLLTVGMAEHEDGAPAAIQVASA